MRIMLACAAGMSTSLLVKKMREAAQNENKDYKIWAVNAESVEQEMGNFDILLLGPQIMNTKEKFRKMLGNNVPCEVIAYQDYGLCRGSNVLKFAEDKLREVNKK